MTLMSSNSTLSDHMIMSGGENGAEEAENWVEQWANVAEKENDGAMFYFLFVL